MRAGNDANLRMLQLETTGNFAACLISRRVLSRHDLVHRVTTKYIIDMTDSLLMLRNECMPSSES